MKCKLLVAVLMISAAAQASLITVGGDPAAGTAYLTFNQDMRFTVNADSAFGMTLIFDEAVISDGVLTQLTGNFSTVWYVEGTAQTNGIGGCSWVDNYADSFRGLTPNDGVININHALKDLHIGDVVVLEAATLTTSASVAGFNQWNSGDYNIYLADNMGNIISTVGSAIPEPATAGLLGISVGVIWVIRLLKKAANYYRT